MSHIEKRAIVTPDKHFPVHDPAALEIVCQAIQLIKPDLYIDLGDVGEWEAVSPWQWRNRKKPPLEYILPDVNADITEVNKYMDDIDEALDIAGTTEKHLLTGNHDEWMNYFVQEHSYLPQYEFRNAVRADERGYICHPLGSLLKVGHLYFYHGHFWGTQYHAKKHLLELGCNIMYGHRHDIQRHSISRHDGPLAAWSVGCLKDMSPEANPWLRGKPEDWAHAFAIVDFFEDGDFVVNLVQILDGRTSVWGVTLDGNNARRKAV